MQAIIPDLHATNFPVGKQRVNDSGSKRDAEAFFEIKTFTACKSRYSHNNKRIKERTWSRSHTAENSESWTATSRQTLWEMARVE